MDDPGDIDLDALLARLDADQLAAVTAPAGPVAVVAGAGSGKTRVLTTRIAYRIASGTAQAPHVVAFTFTRQAAQELQRRLRACGVGPQVVAGTFHGVAYRLLRRRWDDRGRTSLPTLATSRVEVLTEMLSGDRRTAVAAVSEIDWARARLVAPGEYVVAAARAGRRPGVGAERVAALYAQYEATKRRRRLLDFDDLLTECTAELRRPGVADAVSWWHRHLHVDEFQDINPLQFEFLEALRNANRDLFLVGDPAQAIYGWNGADPSLLQQVQDGPLRPVMVRLAVNHRSTPEVVRAADAVLAAHRLPAGHQSARPAGAPVMEVPADDEAGEAATVVALAARLRAPGAPWRSVAVLARTHDLLAQAAVAFRRAGIPTRTITRAGSGPDPFLRAARALDDTTDLHAWAVDQAWPADDEDPHHDWDDRARPGDLEAARRAVATVKAFEESGGGSGRQFAAWAALNGPDDDQGDAVELVTMHAAKGREWPAVIVMGCDTGGFPAPRSREARAEEARLLYVALTRAVDRLAVTWSRSRNRTRTDRTPLLADLTHLGGVDGAADTVAPPPRVPRPVATADPVLHGLRQWRARAAQAAGVAPSLVLDDATLERIAEARPADVEALAAVEGVGPLAARRFADRILAVVARALGREAPAAVGDLSRPDRR